MNKHKKNQRYISHIQNTSPAKTTYSFRRTTRFKQEKSFSPNKYYDQPDLKNKRSTSIGYGQKACFINNSVGDPGEYEVLSVFGKSKFQKGAIFPGSSRQKLYERMYRNGKPGPGQYNVDQKRKVKFYMGKSERLKTEGDQEYNVGPQTYNLKQKCIERLSKFQAVKCLRIKTEWRQKQPLDEYDNKKPGPGAYNPENNSIESKFRISKTNTFGRQEKLKFPRPATNLGPGSYKVFSVFGGGDELD